MPPMPKGTVLSPRSKYTQRLLTHFPLRSPLKEAELAVLRKQYEGEGQFVGVQTKFNYAWGLIKSEKRQEQQLGVKLLTGQTPDEPDGRGSTLLIRIRLQTYSANTRSVAANVSTISHSEITVSETMQKPDATMRRCWTTSRRTYRVRVCAL